MLLQAMRGVSTVSRWLAEWLCGGVGVVPRLYGIGAVYACH